MINYYKTIDGCLEEIASPEENCWISVENPTETEVKFLISDLGIIDSYVYSSLDPEEHSRTERNDSQLLAILDMPIEEDAEDDDGYPQIYTLPIGFILTPKYVITITKNISPIIDEIVKGEYCMRNSLDTANRLNFMFTVVYQIASHFVSHLEYIDAIALETQDQMKKSMKNQDLVQLLNLEKSLVYFTNSLKATELTMEKIRKGRVTELSKEDQDLLEDILVEIKQSIETARVYTGILESTMNAVEAIISNNMNITMKMLTSLTLVLSIPNMVYGFYGMNVAFHSEKPSYIIPFTLSLLISGFAAFVLYKKGFFDNN